MARAKEVVFHGLRGSRHGTVECGFPQPCLACLALFPYSLTLRTTSFLVPRG